MMDVGTISPSAYGGGAVPALSHNVLVLNRFYQAIRVINVRRAFSLLCRELAEVIHIETDAAGKSQWQNLNFSGWQELSALSGWPTIPQVFINGELVGGADIAQELAESGELERRLGDTLGEDYREAGAERVVSVLVPA